MLIYIIAISVPLNVTLLDETHCLRFESSLILLGLHLLSKNISVYVVGWQCLLLESVITVVEITHKVAIIIIDEISTLTRVKNIMLILATA